MDLPHIPEYLLRMSMNQTHCSDQGHSSVSDKLEYRSENTVDGTSLADVHENSGQRCPNMCNLNEDVQRSHFDDSQSVGQSYTRGSTMKQDSVCHFHSRFPVWLVEQRDIWTCVSTGLLLESCAHVTNANRNRTHDHRIPKHIPASNAYKVPGNRYP
ncbi:hypothetical protein AHF37_04356 [Paragonimus kellicotti]|nr:hypothetical protein AHF37_04356 [Paragonimus kellicotti]